MSASDQRSALYALTLIVLLNGSSNKVVSAISLYARIVEFLRNLYMFLPPIVAIFVTLDRLLTLIFNIHYNERRRRIVVYSDLLCLGLMTLIVAFYNYYRELAYLLIAIGVYFLDPTQDWRPRFAALIILKALLGGLNTFNCFAFTYQLKTLPKLKVRTKIVKMTALIELFLGIIPSFFEVWYYLYGDFSNGFQTLSLLISLDSALNGVAYFVLLRKPKINGSNLEANTNSAAK